MTQYQIPEGFTLDPNSGLYYQLTPGMNPETGETGQWTTWFYPDTGDYQQQFHADQPAPGTAVRYAQTAKPMQSKQTKQKPATHKKGRLKPLAIVLPVIALIVGAAIFFTQFGNQGNAVPDGVLLVNQDNALEQTQLINPEDTRITEKQEQVQNGLITLNPDVLDLLGKTNGELRRINGDDCESFVVDDDRTIVDYNDMPVKYPLMFWLLGSKEEIYEIWKRETDGDVYPNMFTKNVWSDWFTIDYIEAWNASLEYVFHDNIPLTYDNMAASFDQESVLSHIPVEAQADWGEWGYGFDIWRCDFSYYYSGLYKIFADFKEVNGEITLFGVTIAKD
jgi:hypothetical protein